MKMPPILLFLLFPLILFGQEKNIDENLLAIAGYDLVSFFSQDNPLERLFMATTYKLVATKFTTFHPYNSHYSLLY